MSAISEYLGQQIRDNRKLLAGVACVATGVGMLLAALYEACR